MRIGLFTDTYLPVRSGMEVAIETIREPLVAMGHEMRVFAPTMHGYHDENPLVVRFRSLRVIKKPEMRLASPWSPIGCRLRGVIGTRLDVIHAQSPFTMGLLGHYVARRQGIPFVYTNHCDHHEYAKVYFYDRMLLPRLADTWIRWFANRADYVLVPSYKFKRLLEDDGVTTPIHVFQTGIDLPRFSPNADSKIAGARVREHYNIPTDAKVLISVGRISEEKNTEFLVRAHSALERLDPDTYLLLVGDGRSEERYKNLARTLGAKKVIFTGKISVERIPSFYHASNVFIFASQTETQGIVILEAMGSGLPVVALEDDALKDVIKNVENGFLVEKTATPDVFASKVHALLNDPETYAELSSAGRVTAAGFTREIQAQKLLAIYESLRREPSQVL